MTPEERGRLEEHWAEFRAFQDRAARLASGSPLFSEEREAELAELELHVEAWEQVLKRRRPA